MFLYKVTLRKRCVPAVPCRLKMLIVDRYFLKISRMTPLDDQVNRDNTASVKSKESRAKVLGSP
jgi:hypothetical protein